MDDNLLNICPHAALATAADHRDYRKQYSFDGLEVAEKRPRSAA